VRHAHHSISWAKAGSVIIFYVVQIQLSSKLLWLLTLI
jgi:hypothetical protein